MMAVDTYLKRHRHISRQHIYDPPATLRELNLHSTRLEYTSDVWVSAEDIARARAERERAWQEERDRAARAKAQQLAREKARAARTKREREARQAALIAKHQALAPQLRAEYIAGREQYEAQLAAHHVEFDGQPNTEARHAAQVVLQREYSRLLDVLSNYQNSARIAVTGQV